MPTYIGTGSYGIDEAARFARVNARTARHWLVGSGVDKKGRVIQPDYPAVGGRHALSFLDVVDLLVVGRFRDEGVSMQTVRKVYARLRHTLGIRHPFAHRKLLTDGRTVFLETLDHVGDRQLEEVISGQGAMPDVLTPYLRQIEYSDQSSTAIRWNIAQGIVLDPARGLGKPLVDAVGTSTFVLARTYHANGEDAELVADLFDTSVEAVLQAVGFEREFAPRAAA